jgi:hypothetical protein
MYKTCKTCNNHLHLEEFHKNPRGKLGRLNVCKHCRKTKIYDVSRDLLECLACNLMKSSGDFYKNSGLKRGVFNICKDCYNIRQKEPINDLELYLKKLISKQNITNLYYDELIELLKKQDYKCAITNHLMTHIINRNGSMDYIWNISILNKDTLVCNFIYSASILYGYSYDKLKEIYMELVGHQKEF